MDDREIAARFDAVDARFDAVDVKFEAVDARFDAVDVKFEAVDARFDAVDVKFEAVDARFDAVDHRLNAIDTRFENLVTLVRDLHESTMREFGQLRDEVKTFSERIDVRLEKQGALLTTGAKQNHPPDRMVHQYGRPARQPRQTHRGH